MKMLGNPQKGMAASDRLFNLAALFVWRQGHTCRYAWQCRSVEIYAQEASSPTELNRHYTWTADKLGRFIQLAASPNSDAVGPLRLPEGNEQRT